MKYLYCDMTKLEVFKNAKKKGKIIKIGTYNSLIKKYNADTMENKKMIRSCGCGNDLTEFESLTDKKFRDWLYD